MAQVQKTLSRKPYSKNYQYIKMHQNMTAETLHTSIRLNIQFTKQACTTMHTYNGKETSLIYCDQSTITHAADVTRDLSNNTDFCYYKLLRFFIRWISTLRWLQNYSGCVQIKDVLWTASCR